MSSRISPATQPADAKELRRLVADWRRGRATKTLWEAFQDAYVLVLSVAVVGAMVIALVARIQSSSAACTHASCLSARTLLPFAVLAGAVALAVAAARLFGPVLASAAEGFWMMDAPIDRARLLRGRLASAITLAGLVGALLGALVSALTGSTPLLVAAWAAATGLCSAGVVAFAAAEQGVERGWTTRAAAYLCTLLAVAVLIVVVGIAAGWFALSVTNDRELMITLVLAGAGLVVLLTATALAAARLNRIRRTRLTSGGALVSGMAGAMYALDLGLARDIVVERRALERGHVSPAKGSGTGTRALVNRDLRRLLRTPTVFLPVIGTVVVPYACVALGFGSFTPMISALALFGALVPQMGALRVLTRTVGLARCLPFSEQEMRQASIVVPGACALLWGLLVTPGMVTVAHGNPVDAIPTALITAIAGVLGAIRWTAAKPIDFGAPMLATQAGAMPPGMITNMVRGFEVALLITIPLVFGWPWLISLLIAGIVYWFVMGNFDMEALREQQEQQQKELAKARAEKEKRRGR